MASPNEVVALTVFSAEAQGGSNVGVLVVMVLTKLNRGRWDGAPQLRPWGQAQLTNQLLRGHPHGLGEGGVGHLQFRHLLDPHAASHAGDGFRFLAPRR